MLAAALILTTAGFGLAATPATAGAVIDPVDGAALAVESMEAGRVDLFTRGSDDALHQKVLQGGVWSGWNDLGGVLASAPAAVSMNAGRMDVFARSSTDTLVQRTFSNGAWGEWTDLGGVLTSAPAAVSWGDGHLEVFARGAGNSLYRRYWLNNAWSGWMNMGGNWSSSPTAASYQSDHVEVFVRGPGNEVYKNYFLGGSWHTFVSMGGNISSAPSLISTGPGNLSVFAQAVGGDVQHRYRNADGSWSNWVSIDGGLYSAPAAVSKNAWQSDVFGISQQGKLQQKSFTTSWQPWAPLGGFDQTLAGTTNTRTMVLQGVPRGTALGAVTYAHIDNIGQARIAHQPDPDNFGTTQWSVLAGHEAFTGEPAIGAYPDGRVQVAAQNRDGDVWTWNRPSDTGIFGPAADAGGWLTKAPALGRLTDGRLVLFGVDGDGVLWSKAQAAANGAYGNWKNLGDVDLAGVRTVVNTRNGLQLFALDGTGALRTAEFAASGTLSAWTTLATAGGVTGHTAVVYPGFRVRVFGRTPAGAIVTKFQDASGTWPSAWDTVGSFTSAGAPAAILDPVLGRLVVVARGADNEIYRTFETAQGSGVFQPEWLRVNADASDPAVVDPTVAPITTGGGQSWVIVFRNANDATRVYTRQIPSAAKLRTKAAAPEFEAHTIPAPPATS